MTDWSTLKKLIWLRIIKGGSAVLKTVTGSLIHITDALARPAEALSVNVEPIQDLHGYDSPWPAGGGVNKLRLSDTALSGTVSGVSYSYDPTTEKITLSGTNTNPVNHAMRFFNVSTSGFSIPSFAVGETYTLSVMLSSTMYCQFVYKNASNVSRAMGYILGTNNFAHVTFTVPSDYVTFEAFQVYIGATATTLNTTIYFELSEGSTAPTSWTPYSNLCPISGRTSATVTRTGANIWDEEWVVSGNRIQSKNYIPVRPNTQYAFVAPNEPANGLRFYDANKTLINTIYGTTGGKFTTPDNCYFILFAMASRYGTTYNNDISINYPATDTQYHPYAGNTYTIQLGETVYGGTLDVTGGKMAVDRAYKLLNDANKWQTATGTVTYRYTEEISRKLYDNSFTGLTCSIAPTIINANYTARWVGANVYYFGIADKASTPVTSLDAIKAMATAGQIAICYSIEPIEITLTPTQIEMLLGENNLWADAGDLTLTYYADGNASTSEALGILLGGTYNNPGGADDVSDDEALGILLGGS